MYQTYLFKGITNFIFIIGQVFFVHGEQCSYNTRSGHLAYRYCEDDCCGSFYNRYCCDLESEEDKHKNIETGAAVGIIFGTIIGILIFLGLILLCLWSFCLTSKRTQGAVQNGSARQHCGFTGARDLNCQAVGATQHHEIYTIPQDHTLKPPPYMPNEPTAPPAYDEIMELERINATK